MRVIRRGAQSLSPLLMPVLVLLLALFAWTRPASANLIPGTTVSVQYAGPGPLTEYIHVPGTGATTFEDVYMGPYSLKVPANAALASLWMCFDAGVNITIHSWTALVADAPMAASLYFPTDPWGTQKIDMISWLSQQWEASPAGPSGAALRADINKAMWEITADYTGTAASLSVSFGAGGFYLKSNDSDTPSVNALLGSAWDNRGQSHGSLFLIPVTLNRSGQYVVDHRTQPFVDPVPEPGALLLLALGLIAAALILGKEKRPA